MPLYEYWCECGSVRGTVKAMGNAPKWLKCTRCGKRMHRDFGVNVGIFEPFMCSDFSGEPIEVTSIKHRDALCKEHHVSPDSFRYTKVKKSKTAIEDLDYGEVKDALANVSDADLEDVRRRGDVERGHSVRGKIPTAII